jgi:hypothetical protein
LNRTSKIVVGLVGVAFAAGIGGCVWFVTTGSKSFVRDAVQAKQDGIALSRGKTEPKCVDAIFKEHRAETFHGIMTTAMRATKLEACLEHAGYVDAFCDGVPAPTEILLSSTWIQATCTRRGMFDQSCGNLMQPVPRYCHSKARADKRERGSAPK